MALFLVVQELLANEAFDWRDVSNKKAHLILPT
jgi:hypothetical protein